MAIERIFFLSIKYVVQIYIKTTIKKTKQQSPKDDDINQANHYIIAVQFNDVQNDTFLQLIELKIFIYHRGSQMLKRKATKMGLRKSNKDQQQSVYVRWPGC